MGGGISDPVRGVTPTRDRVHKGRAYLSIILLGFNL